MHLNGAKTIYVHAVVMSLHVNMYIYNDKQVLIGLGAKTIVVPGVIPMGCVPRYLTIFQSNDPGDYDAAGCIRWLNDFAEEHNRALRHMLDHIRPRDPTVAVVVYADYYGAILEITRSPQKHGMHGGSSSPFQVLNCNCCMLRVTIQSRYSRMPTQGSGRTLL